MITITDCLGRERSPDHTYEDGSWNCPFCMAAVQAGSVEHAERRCPNPACFARGDFPVDRARALIEADDMRKVEEAARVRRVNEGIAAQAARMQADRERRHEVTLEAEDVGACVRCALESIRYGRALKLTKHRKQCPKG